MEIKPLTTGADSGAAFTGGSGNDTFNSVIGTDGLVANGTTLNPGDNLTGGAGSDTLTINISGTNSSDTAQALASVTLTGIETVAINNYEARTSGTSSIDLSLASGVATVAQTGSSASGDTSVTGLKSLVAAKMQYGSGDLSLTYADTAVSGSADVQSLELMSITGGTFTAQATSSGGVETVAITSLGGTRNVLTAVTNATSLKNITVSGDTAVTLGTLGAAVTTLNASANTGGVTATLSSTTTTAITGSSGADSFTTGTVLTTGSVNAGDGADTLVTTADAVVLTSALGAKYTNFETLNISNTSALTTAAGTHTDRAQDVSLISGVTKIGLSALVLTQAPEFGTDADGDGIPDTVNNDNADTAVSVTFSNLSSTVKDLTISGLSYTDTDSTSKLEANIPGTAVNDGITVTLAATLASNTAADDITVTLGTSTAAAGNSLTGTAATDGLALTVQLNNFETVKIVSQGAANAINTLNATELKSLTVTGSKDLTIGTLAGNTATSTIDASAMTGALIMSDNNSATASTITGGSGSDTLWGGSKADRIDGGSGNDSVVGADGNDTVIGGSGNDSINAGGGVDNVDAGDGDDQIYVTTATDFIGLAAAETVIGGAGNDTLTISQSATAITITAADLLGLSGVDRISLSGTSLAGSITLSDAVYTANGVSNLKVLDGDATQGSLTVNAAALTGSNAITVTANTATGVNDTLTGGAGDDTFIFSTTAGLESTDTVVGGAGTDTISLTATANVTADLSGVRTVERVVTTGNAGNVVITVGSDSVLAASTTLTVDASSVTNGTNTLNYTGSGITAATKAQNVTGTAAADTIIGGGGNDVLTGGDGADTITGGGGIDNISGGNGADFFDVGTATDFIGLTAPETVAGGAGTDTLRFAAGTGATVAATDLAGLTSVEVIQTLDTTGSFSVTLTDAVYASDGVTSLTVNAAAMTSGNLSVSASGLSAANAITVTRTTTGADGGDSIVLGAGNDALAVYSDILAAGTTTLTGGTGSDTITITHGADTRTMTALVTGFEKIAFATASVANTISLTTNDANVAAGVTFTVDASNRTAATTFVGTAEADGKFSIVGGSGADILTGGALADTITGGVGVDTITGGLGADVLTGGADSADVFVFAMPTTGSSAYTSVQSNGSNTDSITDFVTGTDKIQIDLNYFQIASAVTVDATVQTARAGTSLIQDNLSGNRGQAVYDTVGSALYVNVNADNLLTTSDYKININPAATATATIADGDINFVITGGTGADTITAGGGADTIDGGAGADSITGGAGADSIIGGAGADTLTGGTQADTFVFANTSTGTPTGTNFDTITDYVSGTDIISFGATNIVKFATAVTAASGTAGVTVTTGVTSFNAADNTLALKVTAIASALGTAAAGNALIFQDGTDSYLYITDGTAGAGSTDVLVKLTGITGTGADELVLTTGAITSLQ